MKTILDIQKLDRQIRVLLREVDKCPASLEYEKYKQIYSAKRILNYRFYQEHNHTCANCSYNYLTIGCT